MIRQRLVLPGLVVTFAAGRLVLAASTDELGMRDAGKGGAADTSARERQ